MAWGRAGGGPGGWGEGGAGEPSHGLQYTRTHWGRIAQEKHETDRHTNKRRFAGRAAAQGAPLRPV